MKTNHYFYILLFCFCLTCCSKSQSELDKTACTFVEATIRMDKDILVSLAPDSTGIELNRIFNDIPKRQLEQYQEKINKYKITTKVIDRDINEKKKYAIITVSLELIKGEESSVKEFLIPFRYIDKHWQIIDI